MGISLTTLPIVLLLMILLSIFSYEWIEKPLRAMSWRKSTKAKLVLAPVSMVWVIFLLDQTPLASTKSLYLGEARKTKVPDSIFEKVSDQAKFSTIRLLGNSHSVHIVPLIEPIADKTDAALVYDDNKSYVKIPFGDKKDIKKLDDVLPPSKMVIY